jgi:RNA polymerase sigma-70 factor (ECF subfamily)
VRETPIGYEKTVRPLQPALRARALRLTHNEAEADDLVQEALLRGFRFWHTFTPGTGAKAWLFTILRNTFYTRCKRASRRREVEDHAKCDAALGVVDTPDAVVATHETRLRVREAISQLPEAYREAVRLADLEGHSYREVATALGCAEGTVMSRLSRGRKRLAVLLTA